MSHFIPPEWHIIVIQYSLRLQSDHADTSSQKRANLFKGEGAVLVGEDGIEELLL